jgi:hypothetical protein
MSKILFHVESNLDARIALHFATHDFVNLTGASRRSEIESPLHNGREVHGGEEGLREDCNPVGNPKSSARAAEEGRNSRAAMKRLANSPRSAGI